MVTSNTPYWFTRSGTTQSCIVYGVGVALLEELCLINMDPDVEYSATSQEKYLPTCFHISRHDMLIID